MKLEVTKEAQEVLKNKLEADDQLLLDIENGDGPIRHGISIDHC